MIDITDFDVAIYVQEFLCIAVVHYIWQPPDSAIIRIDRHLPLRQSKKNWQRMLAINEWACRTDPRKTVRMAHARSAWDRREPGQQVVMLYK